MSIQVLSVGSSPILQSKIISPTSDTQIIQPDQRYDGLSKVTVQGYTQKRIYEKYTEINVSTRTKSITINLNSSTIMDNWRVLCLNFYRLTRPSPNSNDYAILWGGIYDRDTEYDSNGTINCLSVSASQYRNSVNMFWNTSSPKTKNSYTISSNIVTLVGTDYDVFDIATYCVYIVLKEL